jgi:hypothetical protein
LKNFSRSITIGPPLKEGRRTWGGKGREGREGREGKKREGKERKGGEGREWCPHVSV